MVHLRLNETESNPNSHINFINALPSDPEVQQEAQHLLRALAAQVKPVMKANGFTINSFEEYEYNNVFAGRNWNAGETVELVLRRPGGEFYPTSWLMSTLCHELAHIKHMNHGPAFQALWRSLRAEVRQLQNRGYFGDGYWSSGQRLADSATVPGDGIENGEFPEFMCGGAQKRSRPTAVRRRRANGGPRGPRKETVPSLHTGRQTAKARKAGGRVTSKYAFAGEGNAVAGPSNESTKGKRASSNRAREERALAAERRLQALSKGVTASAPPEEAGDSDSEDYEIMRETDAERRETLLSSKQDSDEIEGLGSRNSWRNFEEDFRFTNRSAASPSTAGPSTAKVLSSQPNAAKAKASSTSSKLGPGKLVQSEIDFRKKEALGMAPVKGKGRTLGTSPETRPAVSLSSQKSSAFGEEWACQICTLINEPLYLACSACATPRGETAPR